MTPLGAIVLGINEKIGYASPSSSGFEPSFKAIDGCKKSFYESLQIMSKEAAALPQAGRLSGDAVNAMQKPMEVLLGSFAWPIEDALSRLIEKLKVYRGEEDAEIYITGFGNFNVDEKELSEIIFGSEEMNGEESETRDGRGQESGDRTPEDGTPLSQEEN
jgi:hypothetical protein